ncbi:MAG: hypothetical protein HQL90_09935 [Magnetococcales bacterium]|nr:hypothetical protein [Magnetococcales bacterium]
MKKHPSHKNSEASVPDAMVDLPADAGEQGRVPARPKIGRIKKSALVDEQLFQDGLAISLENEKRQKNRNKKHSAAAESNKGGASQLEQVPATIVNEFENMIDAMLPSTKQERVACMRNAGKKKSVASPAKPKKRSPKKADNKEKSKRKRR